MDADHFLVHGAKLFLFAQLLSINSAYFRFPTRYNHLMVTKVLDFNYLQYTYIAVLKPHSRLVQTIPHHQMAGG